MNKLKWWFRIVGAFYLLLTMMNMYFLFFGDSQMLTDILPAPMNADPLAGQAFADAWLVFVFELGVLGAMSLVASRDPPKTELWHGSSSGRRSFAALWLMPFGLQEVLTQLPTWSLF